MNLLPILQKYFKKGDKLYSLVHGWVTLDCADSVDEDYPIRVKSSVTMGVVSFTREGRYIKEVGGCILFPNPNKDWSRFIEIEEGDVVVYLKDEVWHLSRAVKRVSTNDIGVKTSSGDIYFPEKMIKAELFDFDNLKI